MRHIGRRGTSTRVGVRGAMLVTIALFGLMMVPALALGIEEGGPITAPKALAPVNTAAPTLTGTPALGQTLTCSTGTWANSPTSFSYAWLRSGVPIAGQTASKYVVQAVDQGHTISCQVTAGNGGGSYTITGLASGSYKVAFYSEQEGGTNYLDQFYNGKGTETEATPVAVTVPAATEGVNAELHAGGEITGRVTAAATHAPLAGVYACAYETTAKLDYCEETNSNGEYTITGVPTGSYVVEFSSYAFESDYLTQYYNGKSSSSEAQQVGVTAGTTVAGINAELQSANQGGQISGVVTAKGGSKAALERIEVCAEDTSEVEYFDNCVYTNSKGEYTLSGLPEGYFKVSFYAEDCQATPCTQQNYVYQYYDGKSSYEAATPVPVMVNTTTPLLPVEMEIGGEVEGRVLGAEAGEPPLSGAEVCVFEGDYDSCAETEANGHYKVEGLPTGSYTAEFNSYSGDYLGQTVEKISIVAENVTHQSDVKLAVGGQITGRITGAPSHGPVEKAEVCAEVGGGYGGRCGVTNVNGEYTISALPTNTYTVNVFPEGETVVLLSQAKPGVSVTAGSTTPNVNAELQVGGQISGTVTDAATHAGIAKIDVCAEAPGYGKCAYTSTGAASASAASNALTIPGGGFVLKKVSFDSKSNDLDFFFTFPTAGKLTWGLFFKNADVGFADSLGLSLQANGVAANVASTQVIAEAAKKHKSKGCKKGTIKHHGKCVHLLVPFAAGSQSVAAGSVEVKVHASSKAIKALKAGHTLHVSGTFVFQSAFGGPAVAKQESAVVRLAKKHSKGHGKGKKH
jgi:Carboxypeptidase regulatory-like domain